MDLQAIEVYHAAFLKLADDLACFAAKYHSFRNFWLFWKRLLPFFSWRWIWWNQ
jgi:hypothetical protein